MSFYGIIRHTPASLVEPAVAGPRERLVLRDAVAGTGGHFRPAQRDQLCTRHLVHARRVRGMDRADLLRDQLLADADSGGADRRPVRQNYGKDHAALAVRAGSPVRSVADVQYHAYRL